jgi:SAM-dependent methyltransferase
MNYYDAAFPPCSDAALSKGFAKEQSRLALQEPSHTMTDRPTAGYLNSPNDLRIEEALATAEASIRRTTRHPYFVTHRDRYKAYAAKIASFYENGDLLEVGSSPCHLTATLKLLGYPVIGMDLAPERDRAIIDEFKLSVQRCDVERESWPFPDGRFNYVLFTDVFEHLRVDPLFALSEVSRVMANGGLLFLATPNLYAIQQIARFLAGRGIGDPLSEFMKLRELGHMGHIREYSCAEMKRFLAFNRFRVQAHSYHHFYYPKSLRGMIALVLFKVLPERFRSEQVILARKVGPSRRLYPLR